MIEAMACGIPIVAFRNGSVPEIIEDGMTGFVVDNVEDAVRATARIGSLDRAQCRATFDRRFTAARMAADYVQLYEQLIAQRTAGAVLTGAA
jgi:glycosyltransferase involved in cell wall biosynthesis